MVNVYKYKNDFSPKMKNEVVFNKKIPITYGTTITLKLPLKTLNIHFSWNEYYVAWTNSATSYQVLQKSQHSLEFLVSVK